MQQNRILRLTSHGLHEKIAGSWLDTVRLAHRHHCARRALQTGSGLASTNWIFTLWRNPSRLSQPSRVIRWAS